MIDKDLWIKVTDSLWLEVRVGCLIFKGGFYIGV